ncbi:MAG: hypothetical protein ACQUHE_11790 [Bacteroidia bacterium]
MKIGIKKLVFLLVVGLFTACSPKEVEKVQSKVFLEQHLHEFIGNNPDWVKDDATQKVITEKFKHKMINLSNEADFLKDMPLKLISVKDTSINEIRTKIATFKAYGDTSRTENSLLNYMQLQINGIVTQKQASELKVNENYKIKGSLHKQGKRADVKFIHVAGFRGYDLGKYTFVVNQYDKI